jgi:hypothetical protein
MPVPDLSRPTRVEAKLGIYNLGASTAQTNVLTCPLDTIIRIRAITLSNQTATAYSARVGILRSGVHQFLWRQPQAPLNANINVIEATDLVYLEPNDSLTLTQISPNTLVMFVTYEVVT